MYNKPKITFCHWDKIKNINRKDAKLLDPNICGDFSFKELETINQVSNFECGVHLIVSAKRILHKQKKET